MAWGAGLRTTGSTGLRGKARLALQSEARYPASMAQKKPSRGSQEYPALTTIAVLLKCAAVAVPGIAGVVGVVSLSPGVFILAVGLGIVNAVLIWALAEVIMLGVGIGADVTRMAESADRAIAVLAYTSQRAAAPQAEQQPPHEQLSASAFTRDAMERR